MRLSRFKFNDGYTSFGREATSKFRDAVCVRYADTKGLFVPVGDSIETTQKVLLLERESLT